MKEIELGDKVKDKITSFSGVAVCFSLWINGCERVTVQPTTLNKEGGTKESETFDIEDLVIVTPAKKKKATPSGGPKKDPTRKKDPKRF